MKRLENRVAIVTGGTAGIGEATALRFAREGAQVVVWARNEARGKEMEKKGHSILFTCRDKEFEIFLLQEYGFKYKSFGKK